MHFFLKRSGIVLFIFCALAAVRTVHARSVPFFQLQTTENKNEPTPWFTGPLLTPSGVVVPNGHYNIEPYEYIATNFGHYDAKWQSHSTPNFYRLRTQVSIQIGLPADFDFTLVPQWAWHHSEEGPSHWVLNDFGLTVDYQLYRHKKGSWFPSVKLALRANAPIGKYEKLNPHALGTDIGGTGSWNPRIGLVFSRLYWWGGHIFFASRLSIQYSFPTPVYVRGYNAYGGGHHTHGKVFPGQSPLVQFGFEISLSQRWVLAGDIQYQHRNKARFKGQKGNTNGTPNAVGGPSTESWSLAPAIEYNWSVDYGIIAGVWFTVAGRNSAEFATGVIAFNIYK
jgi:hypothetical protein